MTRPEPDTETGDIERVDLAESQDNSFGVSESLAKIYINQKKYKQALDVYDALILKSPDKRAYFVSLKNAISQKIKSEGSKPKI